MWVQSLGWEDPLEQEMATHSSLLAWEIPRTEEPGGLQSMVLQRVQHNLATEHACLILIYHEKEAGTIKAWQYFVCYQDEFFMLVLLKSAALI